MTPSDDHPLTTFDWKRIVTEHTPRSSSGTRTEQHALLQQLSNDLGEWATRHEIPLERVASTSYYVATIHFPGTSYQQALILCKYILWIFWIDEYDLFDIRDPTAKATLENDFHHILAALSDAHAPADAPKHSPPEGDALHELTPLAIRLGRSLIELYEELNHEWSSQFPGEGASTHDFRLTTCTTWLAAMLRSARQEILNSIEYVQHQTIPYSSIDDYLSKTGEATIAVAAIAAVLNSFEKTPETNWKASFPAIREVSRIIRLTNDIGNYWDEVVELKFNSITMALLSFDAPPFGPYNVESPEVSNAKDIVCRRRESAIDSLLGSIDAVPDGRIKKFLWVGSALALAMYEPGDFVVPTNK